MVSAGELRWPAKFKSPTVATAKGDTTVDPFVEDFDSRVKIEPLAGTEQTVGDQVQPSRVSLVTMRRDARVNERMVMVARGRRFEILSVLNTDERDREMQLHCRELV
jgi:head-tail adaptor